MPAIASRAAFVVPLAVAAACATSPATREAPPPATALPPEADAVLWVGTSEEYRASALQAYAAATASLDRALADSTWTAALEQTGDYADLPPAVIVDLDETAVDNAPMEATLILERDGTFDPDAWADWVNAAEAEPVPGALEFLREADRRGVAVFYVSNGAAALEEGIRRNLERVGLPLAEDRDAVLLRDEREAWTSDKSTRRAHVAGSFRVVLVIGDDLNDFLPARLPLAEREGLARRHAERWGVSWIVLPNPMYGSWEGALWHGRDLSAAEQVEAKREALEAIAH